MSEARPMVSVVVGELPTRRGHDRVRPGLERLDWPAEKLEIIVVDNASGDRSVERIRACGAHCNRHRVPSTTRALPVAATAARSREGAIPRVHQQRRATRCGMGAAAVSVLERDASVVCVASKVLDWEGDTVDFVDAAQQRSTVMDSRPGSATADDSQDSERDVLFAHRRGDGHRCRSVPRRRRRSTTATSCSSKTSTWDGGSGCSAIGSATSPTRWPTTADMPR